MLQISAQYYIPVFGVTVAAYVGEHSIPDILNLAQSTLTHTDRVQHQVFLNEMRGSWDKMWKFSILPNQHEEFRQGRWNDGCASAPYLDDAVHKAYQRSKCSTANVQLTEHSDLPFFFLGSCVTSTSIT